MKLALTYAAGTYDLRAKIMGRQSAGLGFLRAALDAKPECLWCYAGSRGDAEIFARDVRALTETPPQIRFIRWDETGRLAQAGLLFRPDPGITEVAWRRQVHAGARAFSLCGVTHTMSTHAAMGVVRDYLNAPLYPWDAIVCTSRVARDLMRHILEAEMEHLRERVGATRFTLPQLPVIPLGVHTEDFVFGDETRAEARRRAGLDPDEVAVLFAGRLSFHGKGHPLPMFVGLQEARRRTGRRVALILFGVFANAHIEAAFREEGALLAPDVRLIVLEGDKAENRDTAWAAADIFTSLSDNVQETFGLTPVEGMAAGLPVVVSDWNGYKDTVRDGEDGFRVPTLIPRAGDGGDLADRYDGRVDEHDHYIGRASLFTAVDVAGAADAYATLVADPDLRRRMGESGRRRVRDVYDWAVVFGRYRTLWEELDEHRRADPRCLGEAARARRSDRPDPYSLFATFPTHTLTAATSFRLRPGADAAQAARRRAMGSVNYAAESLPPAGLVDSLLEKMAAGTSVSFLDMARQLQPAPPAQVGRALLWLAKMGLLDIDRQPATN